MDQRIVPVGLLVLALVLVDLTEANGQQAPLYDHHVHVLSPQLIKDWKSIGMTFSRPDNAYTDPVHVLEVTGVSGAFLVSMAHLYTTEGFASISEDLEAEQRLVAAENDFIGQAVASSPRQFVGFFSVNPLRDYAFDELRRCRKQLHLTGLKLHLPACGVDLQNQRHMDRLSQTLRWAADEGVPVLLHLTAGEEITKRQATRFWNALIRPHSGLELYLAHLGSAGGFNDASANLLGGYQQLAQQDSKFASLRIYFDLSGAIIPEGFGEGEPTNATQCQQLGKLIDEIGVDRFLFASDYPVFSVAETRASLEQRLELPPDIVSELLANRSPRFNH